jgi:hypothetical protein
VKFTTDPMMVLGYGYWEIDDKPVTNKDGEPVEYVQLLDLDADEIHRYTMRGVAPSGRPEPMTWAKANCEGRTAHKGREDGTVSSRLKVAVVGLESAAAPKPAQAGSASKP